jgi:hypothetical protein
MRLVIEVPDDLHAKFKSAAHYSGRTQAEIVRGWIVSWVGEAEIGEIKPSTAAKPAEPPANAAEAQRRRDEVLRKSRKGK